MNKTGIKDCDLETLKEGLKDKSIILIDIRELQDYRSGHIPGALSFPVTQLDMRVVSLLSTQGEKKRLIIVGKDNAQSLQAIELLKSVGLSVDTYFSKGFTGWQEAGEPVE